MMEVENDVSSFNLKTADPKEPEEYLEHDAANKNHMVQSEADKPQVLPPIQKSP